MRVRFAPSPTGRLHVGNARTALFNWLLARRHGGAFVLRIEDTDAERSTLDSERGILDDLAWLGLDWDEGPNIGGRYGPYRQSDRAEHYAAAARELLARGRAYHCFCTPDELEADRKAALAAGRPPRYPGRCRQIDAGEASARVGQGEGAALRFAVPDRHDVTFLDLVRGAVTFGMDTIGDPVIVRSSGRPAYNFAVVVDDAAMQVTHVVRGEDHISNTPRQLLLYEALGLVVPAFAHLSLVLGPDHTPLSKRHGATSVAEFRDRGFLPEALVNYLALLGWSPGDGREIASVEEMARQFELGRVGHSAAVFDVPKLAWVNRHYMTDAPRASLADDALPYFVRTGYVSDRTPASLEYLAELSAMAVGSVDRLDEMPDRVSFVFDWRPESAAALVRADPDAVQAVLAFAQEIASLGELDRAGFRAAAARVRATTGLKGRALFHPIRVALTAAESGPELDLAVPAIDRGAALPPGSGVASVVSCRQRAAAVAALLEGAAER